MIQSELERAKYWWRMLPKSFYAWIIVLVSTISVLTFLCAWRAEYLFALLVAVLAAIFQISAAYHDKVAHFLECFSRCNAAYAKLNGRLRQPPPPSQARDGDALGNGRRAPIIDYFSLCAEEYLMHKMGVIPDFVWDTWRAGIHDCARRAHLKAAWDVEMKANYLYYGFDLSQIMRQHHKAKADKCEHRDTCRWASSWKTS